MAGKGFPRVLIKLQIQPELHSDRGLGTLGPKEVFSMSCKRVYAVAFHLANPIRDIALEGVEKVKKGCPGFAWVG